MNGQWLTHIAGRSALEKSVATLLGFAFLVVTTPCGAVPLIWDVDTRAAGDWYDQNWLNAGPTGVPTAEDDVLIPEGSRVTVRRDAASKSVTVIVDEPRVDTLLSVGGGTFTTDNLYVEGYTWSGIMFEVGNNASVVATNFEYLAYIQIDGSMKYSAVF